MNRKLTTRTKLLLSVLTSFTIAIFVIPGIFTSGYGFVAASSTSTGSVANPLTVQIPVGYDPQDIVSDSTGSYLYVVNFNNVSVISASSNTVVDTVNLGTGPNNQSLWAAYASSSNSLYVFNHPTEGSGVSTVSVVNASWDVVATIPVGHEGGFVGYNPKTKMIYVPNTNDNNVSIISTKTNKVVKTVAAGREPFSVAFSKSGNTYVSDMGTNSTCGCGTVSVISTKGQVSTIDLASSSTGNQYMAYDPKNNELFVGSTSDAVSIINTTSNLLIKTLYTSSPWGVNYNAKYNVIYVSNYGSNTVSVINATTNSIVTTVSVGSGPRLMTYSPKTHASYVMNLFNSSVTELKGSSVVANVAVAQYPVAAAYSALNHMMYVVSQDSSDGIVTVIS